jgi:threonine dehydratase
MIPVEWIYQAVSRIEEHIKLTPLTYDPENDIYFKWENQQVTGSFKVRGALNKILSLQPAERECGLVTASAGNHGQGVALAGKLTCTPVTVFASEHAVPSKLAAMEKLGAEIILVHGGYGEAERAALVHSTDTGKTWISPYNDGQVIAGQGTIGLEILEQLKPSIASACLVPAGGGGLAAGIGVALNRFAQRPKLIAVQSVASAFLYSLYKNGTQKDVVEYDSLADGLAGPVEDDSLTISLIKRYLDDFVLVTEEEIAAAIGYTWIHYGERIEGSAAVGLAAVLSGKVVDRPALIIISGGNIQPEVHDAVCKRWADGRRGDLQ